MAFSETWTRYNAESKEMGYGAMSENPVAMNDRELATALGMGWVRNLTVTRGDGFIHLYAGRKHWATVYPAASCYAVAA